MHCAFRDREIGEAVFRSSLYNRNKLTMTNCLLVILLLAIAPSVFGVDSTRFRIGNKVAQEETRVRWHQPVCIMAEKDVPSCSSLRKLQTEYEHRSAKGLVDEDESGQTKPIKVEIGETSKGDEQEGIVSDVETLSSDVVGTLPLESSDLVIEDELADPGRTSKLRSKTPELDNVRQRRSARQDRHLTGSIPEHTKAGPIHVTRVLDSPVTATLVARGCLPDIGVPLCAGYQASFTSEIVKHVTKENELILSESHGTREPTIAVSDKSTDSRQDSTFFLKPFVAKQRLPRAKNEPVLDKVRESEIKPVSVITDTLCKISSLKTMSGKWQLFGTLLNNLNVKNILRRTFIDLLLSERFNLSDKPSKEQDTHRSERTENEGFTQSEKGYLKHSTNSEPENSCDQANKYNVIDFLYDSLEKNVEMIAKIKACFRYLLDLHTKLKETMKIEQEQLIKFNVDREINTTAPVLQNNSKIDLSKSENSVTLVQTKVSKKILAKNRETEDRIPNKSKLSDIIRRRKEEKPKIVTE